MTTLKIRRKSSFESVCSSLSIQSLISKKRRLMISVFVLLLLMKNQWNSEQKKKTNFD